MVFLFFYFVVPDLRKVANHDLEAAVDPQTVPCPPIVPIAKRSHRSEKIKSHILVAGAAPETKLEKGVTLILGARPFGKRAGAFPGDDPQHPTPRGNLLTKRGAEAVPLKKVYDPEGTGPTIQA